MIDIRYGSYQFSPGLQTYRFAIRPGFSENFLRASHTYEVEIRGYLVVDHAVTDADAPADLVRQIREFKAAFAIDGQDFTARNSEGEIIDSILSAEILGGLRVLEGPTFEEAGPGELVRKRTFRVLLGGEQVLTTGPGGGGTPANVSRNQSISYEGDGGPRFVMVETMNTPPIKQQTNRFTKTRCTQSGSIVRRYSRPALPAPIHPADEKHDLRQVAFVDRENDTYEVSWTYIFERGTAFG